MRDGPEAPTGGGCGWEANEQEVSKRCDGGRPWNHGGIARGWGHRQSHDAAFRWCLLMPIRPLKP